jgi:hypothetical protein
MFKYEFWKSSHEPFLATTRELLNQSRLKLLGHMDMIDRAVNDEAIP